MWAHLALLDELRHRADRLLDRDFRVHAMLVVEIDVVGAQALERAVDRAPNVIRGAIEVANGGHVAGDRVVHSPGELGGDHILVAVPFDRTADQLLVGEWAVELRGVDEVDSDLEPALNGPDRLALVCRAVEGGHPHASEADGRYVEIS
jgi:hypothetical protein